MRFNKNFYFNKCDITYTHFFRQNTTNLKQRIFIFLKEQLKYLILWLQNYGFPLHNNLKGLYSEVIY